MVMVNAQQGDVHGIWSSTCSWRARRCAVLLRGDAGEGVQARAVRIGAGGVQVIL
jgi:hypothetical protein